MPFPSLPHQLPSSFKTHAQFLDKDHSTDVPAHLPKATSYLAKACASDPSAARALALLLHDTPHKHALLQDPIRDIVQDFADPVARCVLQPRGTPCICNLLPKAAEAFRESCMQGIDILRQAADAGQHVAYTALGLLFLNGLGVDRDPAWAADCLLRAVEGGDMEAHFQLSIQFLHGNGVKKDVKRAAKLLTRAAIRNMGRAQSMLALMFLCGHGVQRDFVTAKHWLKKAEATNDLGAELIDLLMPHYHNGCFPEFERVETWLGHIGDKRGAGWQILQAERHWHGPKMTKCLKHAARKFESAAKLGDGWASCSLGFMKERGICLSQDIEKAISLYQNAVDDGLPRACCLLADLYRHGRGVIHDTDKAMSLYKNAAQRGCVMAKCRLADMYTSGPSECIYKAVYMFQSCLREGYMLGAVHLGDMFSNGNGVRRDPHLALQLYTQALREGHPGAHCALGVTLRTGTLGRMSYKEALYHLQKAVQGGSTSAMIVLGSMFECGEYVGKDRDAAIELYTAAADVGEAMGYCALANAWLEDGCNLDRCKRYFELAFEFGNCYVKTDGLFGLGTMYEDGVGVKRSYTQALGFYKRCVEACEHNPSLTVFKAVTKIGLFYEKGLGLCRDFKAAFRWYTLAAENGDKEAHYRLGTLYEKGRGVERSVQSSFSWYITAAEAGDLKSSVRLGRILEEGRVGKRDLAMAFQCYRAAAQLGERDGMFHWGRCLVIGLGIEKREWEGGMWIRRAAEKGSVKAAQWLVEKEGGNVPVLLGEKRFTS